MECFDLSKYFPKNLAEKQQFDLLSVKSVFVCFHGDSCHRLSKEYHIFLFLILHSKGARNYTTMPLSSSSPLRRPQSSAFVDLNGDLTAGIFYNTYILNIEV